MANSDEDSGSAGCLIYLGLIIIILAIGSLFGSAAGWLIIGLLILAAGVVTMAVRMAR